MLKDIIDVQPLEGYKLRLRFDDGIEGIVDISKIIEFTGIFTPLQDPDYFAKVQVNPDLGTIQWENEADLDPVVLYATITGQETSKLLNATATAVTVQGVVMQIQTPKTTELSGQITIFGAVTDQLCKIQTELTGRDYILAIKAYQERIPIYCTGDLIKENNTLLLKNSHNFTLDATWKN
ncbi:MULTISPECIES: DUF2442 domain-containing protein [unclassified Coleofasciculus]|uniref:DUF2442 domain-containing protein n=1 Tax=unclassified Coleofasciculus TaxID=2692782 RepID=UPI001880E3A5|nr:MULTISPECIES: DUF2442 domain-containing protein [unclassified Coleofasciculus]MBE9126040.1 DUF2442 domain-containing protein [Coleofasciculus sp. LEGE 07081]MBE9148728.1 DUF2442 domain-containing protein [Coleofasciculus sp. LEGE 07092]